MTELSRNNVEKIITACSCKLNNFQNNPNTSNSKKLPIQVTITEGLSYISRSLAYRILTDQIFGPDQEVVLRLLDTTDPAGFLKSIVYEIVASAPNLLKDITYTSRPAEAFIEADIIFYVGKSRDYNFAKYNQQQFYYNDPFFIDSAIETKNSAILIERFAKKNVLVITLGNTAAKIISVYAPSIPKENITAVSIALQNFTASKIATRSNHLPSEIKNVIIWGSNSRQSFPYCKYASFRDGKAVYEVIGDDTYFKKILPRELQDLFQMCRYRLSEAVALADHCKFLMQGTCDGEWVNMSVYSDGSYDIAPDIYYSFPVCCKKGKWAIIQDLDIAYSCKVIMKNIEVIVREKVQAALKICDTQSCGLARCSLLHRRSLKKAKKNNKLLQ